MKIVILSIILAVGFTSKAQAQFDNYKYIVVPKRFDGFKKENQYKTSTLIKHLFTQKGFNTVYDDQLPEDLTSNRCLGLFVELLNQSSMFTTKTTLVLKDCADNEVFSTVQGRSKKKEYEASFAESINDAFRSFDGIVYSYTPQMDEKKEEPITVSFKNDVKKLEEERPDLEKNQERAVEQIATEEEQYYKDRRPIESSYKKAEAKEAKKEMMEQKATPEEQRFKSMEPEPSEIRKIDEDLSKLASTMKTDVGTLYAQELAHGYQLVDSTPKIRMKLFKSTLPNVYIAESGTINGVVFTENGKWFFQYYKANELVTEELNIKF